MDSIPQPKIAVIAPDGGSPLGRLADQLGLPTAPSPEAAAADLVLVDHEGRLALRKPGGGAPVAVEFGGMRRAGRTGGNARPLLCRAVGLDRGVRSVVDATAGLGRDAFTLAAWGAEVVLVERDPILHALLADGLRRAEGSPAAARMTLVHGDAREVLAAGPPPDAVFLDPMFEDRGKAALPGWELQVLRALLGPGEDAVEELLAEARRVATRRVVVKRPAHGRLVGHKPDASYVGGRIRYEVFTPRGDRGPQNPTDT